MTEAKTGRPTSYTDAIGDSICEKLAEGVSLNRICKAEDMPHRATVHRWLLSDNPQHDSFRDKYALARQMGYECMADDILDIADDGSNDWMESENPENPGFRINGEALGRSRLRVDTRKWFMSKVLPKFKDKDDQQKSGAEDLAAALSDLLDRLPN